MHGISLCRMVKGRQNQMQTTGVKFWANPIPWITLTDDDHFRSIIIIRDRFCPIGPHFPS